MRTTLFEKIWRAHAVKPLGATRCLVHVARHLVHEGSSAEAFAGLRRRDLRARHPELTLAVTDHVVSTAPGRTLATFAPGLDRLRTLQRNCRDFGIRLFDVDHRRHGIAHVVAPELGFVLPGLTVVCGDSHTATCGAFGALAWGIGTTEIAQVLAAQALVVTRPRTLRVHASGRLQPGVSAKDLILHLIGTHGIGAGAGHAVEYAGPAIEALSMEGRMTVCNMSAEFGARFGFVAPDERTFDYLHGRPCAPQGAHWTRAVADWQSLRSDADASFDRDIGVDASALAPQVTWGTTPQAVLPIGGVTPDPDRPPPLETRASVEAALQHMGLRPRQPLEGLPVDYAFIGSCTNSRLADLEAAAHVVAGRKVAPGVRALVVPGSSEVKRAAERLGLDRVFVEAGFAWRQAGCSMCVAANEDVVPAGKRCISTSNRNFVDRQGPGSRTHLASPAMVAAAAVTGRITDVRKLLQGP